MDFVLFPNLVLRAKRKVIELITLGSYNAMCSLYNTGWPGGRTRRFSPEDFNDYLEEKLTLGDGTYIGIGDISAWDGLYSGDGIHFTAEGNRRLFELIISAVKSGGR